LVMGGMTYLIHGLKPGTETWDPVGVLGDGGDDVSYPRVETRD